MMASTVSLQMRMVRKEAETPDICAFELQSLDGSALLAFEAGGTSTLIC